MAERGFLTGDILDASSDSRLVVLGTEAGEALMSVAWETFSKCRVYEYPREGPGVVAGVGKATEDAPILAGVPSVPGAALSDAIVNQRRRWIETKAAKLSMQYLASVAGDLKIQASFSELSSGQAGVLWSENHGDLFADQIRAALSKSPIQSEGSNAHDWEEQQMQSQCTRAQGSLREQSERCLPEETSSSNLCCVQLNTWALCFADSATERSFVASQNRSQISVDQVMFIIMLFWYFIFPLLTLSGEGHVCPSPALWGHGLAIAVPSLLSIFGETSYAEWREVLLAGLSFMPLPGVPGSGAVVMQLLAQAFVILRETLGFQVRFAVWAPARTLVLVAFLLLEFPGTLAALPWAAGSKLAFTLLFVTCAHVIPLAVCWCGEHARRRKFAASTA